MTDPVPAVQEDLTTSGEFEIPPDMFVEDLPAGARKNRKLLYHIRRADLKARRVYDVVDRAIARLQELREKLKTRGLQK